MVDRTLGPHSLRHCRLAPLPRGHPPHHRVQAHVHPIRRRIEPRRRSFAVEDQAVKSRLVAVTIPFLTLALSIVSLTSCDFTPQGKRYAVLVGISKYAIVTSLNYTDDDAKSMEKALQAKGYSKIVTLLDNQATRTGILAALSEAASTVSSADTFLFYYSGHGAGFLPPTRVSGEAFAYRPEGLVPYDLIDSSNQNQMISPEVLRDSLKKIPSLAKIVILDSCHSGAFIETKGASSNLPGSTDPSTGIYYPGAYPENEGTTGKAPIPDPTVFTFPGIDSYRSLIASGFSMSQAYDSGIMVLSAAGSQELSLEPFVGSPEHGYFTYLLLEAMEQGDLDGSGYLTVSEAWTHIARRMYAFYNKTYTGKDYMTRVSGGDRDFILF